MAFVHLHVHTEYSIRDGLSLIKDLFARAEELNMPGLAITDHGNMFGVKEFFNCAQKHPSVKPILGCEVYVTRHYDHKLKDSAHRAYYHLILLAKNYKGYQNLMKIVSISHIEGRYYRPRVSHEVIEKYSEGLICCSACIAGEVPRAIEEGDVDAAMKAIEWHKRVFGDDYYLEVQLHRTEVPGLSLELYERQQSINETIFALSERTGVKVVATNDVHFVRKEDGPAHDRIICMNSNTTLDDPDRMRYTQQEYLKSEEEMLALFPEHPEVISTTIEILDKVEKYSINRGHVLPRFKIDPTFLAVKEKYLEKYKDVIDVGLYNEDGTPRGEEFAWSVAYLCHLCYEGAHWRYGEELSRSQADRIDFELKTITKMGFPDYFLIVQDFIAAARAAGTSVGPGRGSAGGSVVAYCLKITNLDPLKYDLLFERFLNPERISMPDIDVDFDDECRYGTFKYIEETYGKEHVAHVITFTTMAAKSAIKDVARISNLPLDESTRLTKMVPEAKIQVDQDGEEVEVKPNLKICIKHTPELKNEYKNGTEAVKEVLKFALQLEGRVRQEGVHACAMIIGSGNLTDYIPITLATDKASKEVWTTQYDGHYIEEVGLLKMDFLGLKTLSIIKECLALIKQRRGKVIDIESIPIDDKATYDLFSRGDTISVFQFEAESVKSWLQRLKPTRFEDLIAMNALNRPGPMQYIPSFVARKNGEEKVTYDLPEMEEILSETYGVTVYQEQVMLLSQKIAGFTKGQADQLRKAMGKKNIELINALNAKFIEGGLKNGYPKDKLTKIYNDWRHFAEYAFNKSHSTCYSWVSYQTAYLKAHYPAEFQAANLSKNLDKQKEIKKIMDDCRRSGMRVLLPDINESNARFTVTKAGDIRFGLCGIKGFGDNIVSNIIAERETNGPFADIYNFAERMGRLTGRKAFELLVDSGAFDSFGHHRRQYSMACPSGEIFLDELIKYADQYNRHEQDSITSLFGDAEELKPIRPELPQIRHEEKVAAGLECLHKEKALLGMYLSSHPLEKYSFELETFTSHKVGELSDCIARCEASKTAVTVKIGGFITATANGLNKKGKPTYTTTLEDFSGSYDIRLTGSDVDKFMPHLQPNFSVFITGRIEPMFYRSAEEVREKGGPPYVFRPQEIIMLSNVTEKSIKEFSISINTVRLTPEFGKTLKEIIKKHRGNTSLSMTVYDPITQYKIEFKSNKFRVAVDNELVQEIRSLDIQYDVVV